MIKWLGALFALLASTLVAAQEGYPDVNAFVPGYGYRLLGYSGQTNEQNILAKVLVRPDGAVLYGLNITFAGGGGTVAPMVVDLMSKTGGVAPSLFTTTYLGTPGSISTTIVSLALQTDGKVLVLVDDQAAPDNTCYLYRLQSTGTLDNSFGSGGLLAVPFNAGFPNGQVFPAEVLVQPDNKIVVAASVGPRPPPNQQYSVSYAMAATRLSANGAIDSTYGNGGTAVVTRLA